MRTLSWLLLLVLFLGLILAMIRWAPRPPQEGAERTPAERAGIADAERAIAGGTLKLKVWGYRAPEPVGWVTLMRERLGVEVEVVGGCVLEPELKQHAEAYNARMKEAIRQRFGADALEKVAEEAEKQAERAK